MFQPWSWECPALSLLSNTTVPWLHTARNPCWHHQPLFSLSIKYAFLLFLKWQGGLAGGNLRLYKHQFDLSFSFPSTNWDDYYWVTSPKKSKSEFKICVTSCRHSSVWKVPATQTWRTWVGILGTSTKKAGAQQVKERAAKLDSLSSIPGTHILRGENWLLKVVLWPPRYTQ